MRLLPGVVFALSLQLAAACAPRGPSASTNVPGEGRVVPVDVPDERFAQDLHRVLRDGTPSAARSGLLVGVVRRQLGHAAQRYASGHRERATDSVMGALYLVRAGEGRAEMVDAAGAQALAGAIERVSARGDEGRALALMRMRQAALPAGSPERAALDKHLESLTQWMKETRTGGPMRQLGASERAAVARAMVEPSPEAVREAASAVSAWIDKAIEYNFEFRQTGRRPEREEAVEASRALETGAVTLAALFLRHGDAKGALEHVERTAARRIIQPPLYERLYAAANGNGSGDWLGLAAEVARTGQSEEDFEIAVDPALTGAALWGAALEAYRRDPQSPQPAMRVAEALVAFGMSEAAPLVAGDAVLERPNPAGLSASMRLVIEALSADAEIDDHAAARRTFAASAALLAAADKPEVRKAVNPSAARARFLMATIAVRSGDLGFARPLLESAVAAEPSVSAHHFVALVDRQSGKPDSALAQVSRALSAPDAKHALLDLAETNLLGFEIHRERGDRAQAQTALDAALSAVLAARERGAASSRARAERVLGRVLDGYGDAKGAARALERAFALAASDRPALGATVLDAVGRALVRRDLAAARSALNRGIEADVDEDDLVYAGLWVWLLERELGVKTDGTAERALRTGSSRGTWTAKLAAWQSGRMSDADLGTAAQSTSQKVEAAFYTAMVKRVSGDPAATDKLRDVAKSPMIDLLEVQLARELLAPRVRAELPANVRLP